MIISSVSWMPRNGLPSGVDVGFAPGSPIPGLILVPLSRDHPFYATYHGVINSATPIRSWRWKTRIGRGLRMIALSALQLQGDVNRGILRGVACSQFRVADRVMPIFALRVAMIVSVSGSNFPSKTQSKTAGVSSRQPALCPSCKSEFCRDDCYPCNVSLSLCGLTLGRFQESFTGLGASLPIVHWPSPY